MTSSSNNCHNHSLNSSIIMQQQRIQRVQSCILEVDFWGGFFCTHVVLFKVGGVQGALSHHLSPRMP